MKKIKIVAKGWETYTGFMGMVEFVNAVSVDAVPQQVADRLSAVIEIVEIDEDGEKQAGTAARLVGGATIAAPVIDAMNRASEADLRAEQVKISVNNGKPPTEKLYSVSDLEKIADEKGIHGLREIGDRWNVRERSIPGLIKVILKAQAEFQKRVENAAPRNVTPSFEADNEVQSFVTAVVEKKIGDDDDQAEFEFANPNEEIESSEVK